MNTLLTEPISKTVSPSGAASPSAMRPKPWTSSRPSRMSPTTMPRAHWPSISGCTRRWTSAACSPALARADDSWLTARSCACPQPHATTAATSPPKKTRRIIAPVIVAARGRNAMLRSAVMTARSSNLAIVFAVASVCPVPRPAARSARSEGFW